VPVPDELNYFTTSTSIAPGHQATVDLYWQCGGGMVVDKLRRGMRGNEPVSHQKADRHYPPCCVKGPHFRSGAEQPSRGASPARSRKVVVGA